MRQRISPVTKIGVAKVSRDYRNRMIDRMITAYSAFSALKTLNCPNIVISDQMIVKVLKISR